MSYINVVELKLLEDETPALALSGLIGRIMAVQVSTNDGIEQIGQASGFHLKWVTWPHDGPEKSEKRLALCCKAEVDQKRFDKFKPMFLDGGIQLFVGNHQIAWCEAIGD